MTYHGIQAGRQADCRVATLWFVFLLLPVLPLRRFRFRLQGQQWLREKRLRLDPRSIIKTYLWGSLAAPLAFFGPLILCVREIYEQLGGPPSLHIPIILVAIAWLVFGIWKALDHQSRSW